MFQNMQEEQTKEETGKKKNILTNAISKKYILLYAITFMISTIGMKQSTSPCSLAIVAAIGANEIPIVISLVLSFVGNIISCGFGAIPIYIITMLLFFASFFIAEPKYNEQSKNEKIKFGKRICISSLIVEILKVFISGFLWYDLLVAISMSILTFVLYKIFVNGVSVLIDFYEKRAFTLEEIMGAAVMLTISICCLGNLQIFDFSIRNIIAIFIVLVLGWKNGMLVGATSGITIGVTLGIIAETDPVIIAAYAISGLVAGILNKFGKIGVIAGFILGDIILTYLQNGGLENLIVFKEILIAGIGLLAVPKSVKLDIQNIFGDKTFLPVAQNRTLNRSTETAEKLKKVSKAVENIANSYNEVPTTDDTFNIEKNKHVFIAELLNSTDNMEENILYDNISNTNGKIVNDIFEELQKKQFIKEKDLIEIFQNNNNYVLGFEDDEKSVKREVEKMTQAINSAYRISKMSFIYDTKLKEKKINVGTQLNGISKAISEIADDIKHEINSDDIYAKEEEKISFILTEKNIVVQDISVTKKDDKRFYIELCTELNSEKEIEEKIKTILEKAIKEKLKLEQRTTIDSKKIEVFEYISDDKYRVEIGQAIAIKDGMNVSGDSILTTKLKDGKYIFAISDGMGSGGEAKKSSTLAIKMLKNLLDSGFNKETSIELINSNLINVREEVYATLDLAVLDLYNGVIEFIKNGSAPTYIKSDKKITIVKSNTLPAGIAQNPSKASLEKNINDGDIILMCSDGVIDSNVEYKNKSLWVKYMLEDIQNTNPQKIADIILNEAVDNGYGQVKDDMSIIAFKIIGK